MFAKLRLLFCGISMTLLLITAANGQQDDGPGFAVIEIFGCTFNDGNDMGDLMAVTDRWNDWADSNGVTDYTANIMTPYFYSTAFPYDVLWLGVYPGAEAMGEGVARWLADGQAMNEEFGEVVTCAVHGQFIGVPAHIPATPPAQDDGMVNLSAFQDCTLINETSNPEALAAHGRWGDYLAENGSDVFMAALFPIAGEDPAAGYDYKAVANFSSAVAYGNFIGTIVPGGLNTAGQIFGRTTECDTSRVYVSQQVRSAAQDD